MNALNCQLLNWNSTYERMQSYQDSTSGNKRSRNSGGSVSSNHRRPSGKPAGHRIQDYSEGSLVVAWEVPQTCNLSYDYCRVEATPDCAPGEPTTEDRIGLFGQVAEFSPQPILVQSGGGPLMRSDLFKLLDAADRIEG